jgi:hypothetical protein
MAVAVNIDVEPALGGARLVAECNELIPGRQPIEGLIPAPEHFPPLLGQPSPERRVAIPEHNGFAPWQALSGLTRVVEQVPEVQQPVAL